MKNEAVVRSALLTQLRPWLRRNEVEQRLDDLGGPWFCRD